MFPMVGQLLRLVRSLSSIEARLERLQLAVGRIEARLDGDRGVGTHEFQVFSQWGEDGILSYLLSQIAVPNEVFVEFGVEAYQECNTRFLLMSRYWRGLVMDGDEQNIRRIRESELYWRYRLEARHAFVTRENIDSLLKEAGISGDIGLLSIDIDGNDYWVWEGITSIQPRVVVVEYNSLFGDRRAVTIPYDPAFVRLKGHHSGLYFGASVPAFAKLGAARGYSLVAGNQAGNNLFFVRNDVLGELTPITPQAAYRRASFRESRDADGKLTFLEQEQGRALVRSLPVIDLESGREVPIASL
jgi:hypothetical protein